MRYGKWLMALMGAWMLSQGVWAGERGVPRIEPGLVKALEHYAKTGQAKGEIIGGIRMIPFGLERPEILCAPFKICTVAMEDGERVKSLDIGDKAAWFVRKRSAGVEGQAGYRESIVVKPFVCDIETSLSVFTTRREYHIGLRSLPCGSALEDRKNPKTAWVPQTAFWFPQSELEAWTQDEIEAETAAAEAARAQEVKPEYSLMCHRYDYSTRARRDFPWEPTVLCSNEGHTLIGVPQGTAELGVLYETTGRDHVLINYRVVEVGDQRFLETEHPVEKGRIVIRRKRGKPAVLEFEGGAP